MTKDVRGVMVAIAWVVLAAALAGCATSARPARVAEPASPAATNSAPVVESALPPPRPEVARIRPGLVISFSLLVGGKVEFGEVTKRISDAGTLVLPLPRIPIVSQSSRNSTFDAGISASASYWWTPSSMTGKPSISHWL